MADEVTQEQVREMRKRNRAKVEAAEQGLEQAERIVTQIALDAGRALRVIREHRETLRSTVDLPEMGDLPPLFEQAPTAEPEKKTTKRGAKKDAD